MLKNYSVKQFKWVALANYRIQIFEKIKFIRLWNNLFQNLEKQW